MVSRMLSGTDQAQSLRSAGIDGIDYRDDALVIQVDVQLERSSWWPETRYQHRLLGRSRRRILLLTAAWIGGGT
jgi:hypothetical protein